MRHLVLRTFVSTLVACLHAKGKNVFDPTIAARHACHRQAAQISAFHIESNALRHSFGIVFSETSRSALQAS